jgi:hypothetical protein
MEFSEATGTAQLVKANVQICLLLAHESGQIAAMQ